MRLFFAAPLPEALALQARRAQTALAGSLCKGRLTAPENLHLTLVFLGELPQPDPAARAVDLAGCQRFSITCGGLDRFCKRGGDVVYLQVAPSEELMDLANRLRCGMRRAGISVEAGAYHPHITLARGARLEEDLTRLNARLDLAPVSARIDRFCLMRSWRPAGELVYTPVQTWHLH